jgi:hypothetical protein
MSDLFFTANTTEFLKDKRATAETHLATYRHMPRKTAADAQRMVDLELFIAAIDDELKRRLPHAR